MGSCVAFNCTNRASKKIPGLTFHSFPKDEFRRKLWVKAVRRANWRPRKRSKLCSNHFPEEMIDRTSLSMVRLRDNAVPSIFDFSSHLEKGGKSIVSKRKKPSRAQNGKKSIIGERENPSSAQNAGVVDFKSLYKEALDQLEETQLDLSMEEKETLRLKQENKHLKNYLYTERQKNKQLQELIDMLQLPENNLGTCKRIQIKQEKNSCSISEAELAEKSQLQDCGDLNTGDFNLNNPFKKECNYPDTRYQHSTTLFPAETLQNSLPLETPNEVSKYCAVGELISTMPENEKIGSDSTNILETPNENSEHHTVGELISTMPKKEEIRSYSSKKVESTISGDVHILEPPTKKIKVIELAEKSCSVHPIMCRCTLVRTSYLQNRLPEKPNTILQGNDDIKVKVEPSEENM